MAVIVGFLDTSGKIYSKEELVKALIGASLSLLHDENIQVNGFTMFMDMTDMTAKQLNYFGIDDVRKITKMYMVIIYIHI